MHTWSSRARLPCRPCRTRISKSSSSLATFGGGLLTEAASAAFDVVLVFVLSVYMLIYGQRIGSLVRRAMPPGDGTPADDYPTLAQHAVSRYVGGQLLFSLIMGVLHRLGPVSVRGAGDFPRRGEVRGGLCDVLRRDGVDPLHRPDPRCPAAGHRGARDQSHFRSVGAAAVRRPAAAGGPRGGATDLLPHAAHQSPACDLRAVAGPTYTG